MSLEDRIRDEALRLGFAAVGITAARPIETSFLHDWLRSGHQADMQFMERDPERRVDPEALLPGARSVISVALDYHRPDHTPPASGPKISRYAVGRDYHLELPERLNRLLAMIQRERPGARGFVAVDAQPTCDKIWAQRAGVGWIGKHSNVLRQGLGSWFFLGELIVDLELAEDAPAVDHCGTCTACIDACPTGAIVADRVVDARRCISYWTIERRGEIPEAWRNRLDDWIFGCDVCQEVCPWNREAPSSAVAGFAPRELIARSRPEELMAAAQQNFKRSFPESALERTRRGGFLRNLTLWLARQPGPKTRALLEQLVTDRDANVRHHVQWALRELEKETET